MAKKMVKMETMIGKKKIKNRKIGQRTENAITRVVIHRWKTNETSSAIFLIRD